ncbi:TetR/AcrR family transcriptional regulator [Pseudoalteromonas sp. NZS127_1]|uniref:TetR/AcrR family transcriptional regulator n=1 Tax=unclassified Pseudoalteromonas TaxID=194690 RepID=UPI0018CD277C|nr:TetR/AcrR family transcriptional regulator [Pseudoalteromonas sp. NZS127_1]MBH0050489.1 TetR/AcrR family transcriptional regulator [Pseudoalteromonas sp. SWYJZ19]
MKAGRKRAFDKEVVLDKAMRLFWANGFSGTSVANLSSELGINTSSLYGTFVNKEQLFKDALAHYQKQYVEVNYRHLVEPSDATLKARLQACFYGLIELFTSDETPRGCLLVKSVNESDSVAFPEDAVVYMKKLGTETQQTLTGLFASGIAKTDMPQGQTAQKLTNYLLSVSYGLAVQAKVGLVEEELKSVLDHALNSIFGYS